MTRRSAFKQPYEPFECELEQAQDEIEELKALIRDFTDDGDCQLDHHGYCQEHMWFSDEPCPHKRAKAILGATP